MRKYMFEILKRTNNLPGFAIPNETKITKIVSEIE